MIEIRLVERREPTPKWYDRAKYTAQYTIQYRELHGDSRDETSLWVDAPTIIE